MFILGSAFKGSTIQANDGVIGNVSDILFDDRSWTTRWVVVDTGMWLPGRQVLLPASAIGSFDSDALQLSVGLSKSQVEGSPDISADQPVSRQMEQRLYSHYMWDPVGDGDCLGGTPSAPALSLALETEDQPAAGDPGGHGDPHLRAVAALRGYYLHATDGEIGHLDNVMLDSDGWCLRYLIVATRNWWPGKHVVLRSSAVREIDWAKHEFVLDVTRAAVQGGPVWNAGSDEDFAAQLRRHEAAEPVDHP